jgi:hypothetical protein
MFALQQRAGARLGEAEFSTAPLAYQIDDEHAFGKVHADLWGFAKVQGHRDAKGGAFLAW